MGDYKIYPKQFQYDRIPIDKNKCFMIMPFDNKFLKVYDIVKDELNRNNIICARDDEITSSKPIMNKVINAIIKSQFIIAELTECNANVYYELGIAHSFRDSRNILLIKQKNSKYPFDLSHLPYKEYDPKDETSIRDIISSFISESRYSTDFLDVVELNNINVYSIDKKYNYIEYIQDYFESNIIIYTDILDGKSNIYSEQELKRAFDKYDILLRKAFMNQPVEMLNGFIKLYILLIINCNNMNVSFKYAYDFSDFLSNYDLKNETEHPIWIMDLMIELASKKKHYNICMPWIINYFSKQHSTNIDLNRYKLERFLLTSEHEEVNEYMIDALYSNNCQIRESMADILGEKKLLRAYQALYKRLEIEKNNYVTRSLVEAIGKIGDNRDIEKLNIWFQNNILRFENDKYLGIYNHMVYALQKLDTSYNKIYLKEFIKKYHNKITIPGVNPKI